MGQESATNKRKLRAGSRNQTSPAIMHQGKKRAESATRRQSSRESESNFTCDRASRGDDLRWRQRPIHMGHHHRFALSTPPMSYKMALCLSRQKNYEKHRMDGYNEVSTSTQTARFCLQLSLFITCSRRAQQGQRRHLKAIARSCNHPPLSHPYPQWD